MAASLDDPQAPAGALAFVYPRSRMISTATAPPKHGIAETAIMHTTSKARSIILYGSSITLGLILCKAWFFAQSLI